MADHPPSGPQHDPAEAPDAAAGPATAPSAITDFGVSTRGRLPWLAGIVAAVGVTFAAGAAAGGASFPWSSASDTRTIDDAVTTTDPAPVTSAREDPADEPATIPEEPTTAPTEDAADEATTTSVPSGDGAGDAPTAAERHGWELADEDTFDGPQLDTAKWSVYEGEGNGGVGWRSPDALSQSDGTLKITGRGDVSGGLNWNGGRTYGRWEIRARSDAGSGYAPNLLLWPSSGNWPAEGEVNIMEIPDGDRSQSLAVLHYGEENNQYWQWTDGEFTEWHNFAVEWLPDRVTVYIDGEEIASWDDPEAIPTAPMHLAIQNDVGPHDGFIPPRDANTPAEVSLEVDWVRLYAP